MDPHNFTSRKRRDEGSPTNHWQIHSNRTSLHSVITFNLHHTKPEGHNRSLRRNAGTDAGSVSTRALAAHGQRKDRSDEIPWHSEEKQGRTLESGCIAGHPWWPSERGGLEPCTNCQINPNVLFLEDVRSLRVTSSSSLARQRHGGRKSAPTLLSCATSTVVRIEGVRQHYFTLITWQEYPCGSW